MKESKNLLKTLDIISFSSYITDNERAYSRLKKDLKTTNK
jgi:hypothetical protein